MTSPPLDRIGVLFVCLGNICRSPLAEGIFLHMVEQRDLTNNFDIDSAGTGHWHIGHPADIRSINIAHQHGITLPSLGRQIDASDFTRFHHLIALDDSIAEELKQLGAPAERVSLMLDYHPGTHLCDVPDPYLGSADGFVTVYNLIEPSCRGLLDQLVARHTLHPG
ncbi:MAG: low molecular weight protein-tyrosine-phosphatase [Phycisphaerales bacterium]